MSRARDRWLDEGVAVLAEQGAAGVRIDRIAARLGLSKGSFHHHFDGAEGFKHALLGSVEQRLIEGFRAAVAEAGDDAQPRDVLAHLTALVKERDGVYQPALEVAIRSWAAGDADAAETQARIDQARLEVLSQIWHPLTPDDRQARLAALLPYLLAVGATVLVPQVGADELHELYERILPLVPTVDEQPRRGGGS